MSENVRIEPLLTLLADAGGELELWEGERLQEIRRAKALGLVRVTLTGGFQGATEAVTLTATGRRRMGLPELPAEPRLPWWQRLWQ